MTPGGVVAGRLLAAFAPADRAEAAQLLALWVRVPRLSVADVREILADYDPDATPAEATTEPNTGHFGGTGGFPFVTKSQPRPEPPSNDGGGETNA